MSLRGNFLRSTAGSHLADAKNRCGDFPHGQKSVRGLCESVARLDLWIWVSQRHNTLTLCLHSNCVRQQDGKDSWAISKHQGTVVL